jgi:hypothetical protein
MEAAARWGSKEGVAYARRACDLGDERGCVLWSPQSDIGASEDARVRLIEVLEPECSAGDAVACRVLTARVL